MTRRDPRQGSRYWGLIRRQGERVGNPSGNPSEPSSPVPAKWPCQALGCEWRGEATDCPEHGVMSFYRDADDRARWCYRVHGPSCNKGCGNSGD